MRSIGFGLELLEGVVYLGVAVSGFEGVVYLGVEVLRSLRVSFAWVQRYLLYLCY